MEIPLFPSILKVGCLYSSYDKDIWGQYCSFEVEDNGPTFILEGILEFLPENLRAFCCYGLNLSLGDVVGQRLLDPRLDEVLLNSNIPSKEGPGETYCNEKYHYVWLCMCLITDTISTIANRLLISNYSYYLQNILIESLKNMEIHNH